MKPILLSPFDLGVAALLVLADACVSLLLRLRLHRPLLIASARATVQLLLVGYMLRLVFAAASPWLTAGVVMVMTLVAVREVAARPQARLAQFGNQAVSLLAVGTATIVTVALALATAIRPQPWWDPRYAIPLAGIVLGSVLNAGSLALDSILGGVARERAGIEAQLALGASFRTAIAPLLRESMRRALMPIINQMSAAGIITLPGIMTGQILAGFDPVEAVKYQILLLFLLSGASFLAAFAAAAAASYHLTDGRQRLRLDRLEGR